MELEKILSTIKGEKGYVIELNDANRILEEIKGDLEKLEINRKISQKIIRWKNQISDDVGIGSLFYDPSNVQFLYEDIGLKTPEWYEIKYGQYFFVSK